MSFNWTQLLPGVGHEYSHVATLGLASVGAITMGLIAKSSLGTGEAAVIPTSKFSMRGFFELVTESMSGLTESVIGKQGRSFTPFFSAIFFFVLINNLIGIVPGMTPATENLNTTLGFGLFMFVAYNFLGMKHSGVINYLKHFMGPALILAPLMVVIELISHMVRPMSLGLRLANVMKGDHTVLAVFLDLVPIGIPIPFYLLGLIVCFIQAFVFTLLSMVYVSLAVAGDHHH
ncbi:MAG TPA: F0F1 ATP synthase subunit A [Pseudobdellovibrionaceae bacterium]|nr:F0F1 ATP synthase subunit A [Pseudobdellovibrionaceae bacterium]